MLATVLYLDIAVILIFFDILNTVIHACTLLSYYYTHGINIGSIIKCVQQSSHAQLSSSCQINSFWCKRMIDDDDRLLLNEW